MLMNLHPRREAIYMRFDPSKHTMAPPPARLAWAGTRSKTTSSASFSSPDHSCLAVPTVDAAHELIQKTTNALDDNHREIVAICERMFEPLCQFIGHGDLVQELADQKKEVANLKVANSLL